MASSLKYLTVQDILWVNFQLTRKSSPFDYAKLEEAVYYQYSYGDSDELVIQAARFLAGFSKQAPFEGANDPTAFVGTMTFLRVNGFTTDLDDSGAAVWFAQAKTSPKDAVAKISSVDQHYHAESVKDAVMAVIRKFPRAIEALGGSPVEVIADGALH
ncbi:hypothetical protein BH11ARM1_BH11ARM1_18150 [soil metagenome]